MRILLTLLFTTIFASLHAQTMVCYNYDAAGNRIQKGNSICPGFTGEELTERSSGNSPALVAGKIIPNPNNGLFEMRLEAVPEGEAWYELYDVKGTLVLRQKAEGAIASFDLSGKVSGEYFLFLRSSSHQDRSWMVVKQ